MSIGNASEASHRPEIVVGLVGPLGTDLRLTSRLVEEVLRGFGYDVAPEISMSSLLDRVPMLAPLPGPDTPRDVYVNERMDAGNTLRERTGRGDTLAVLAMRDVARHRAEHRARIGFDDGDLPVESFAYILRSLKHADEAEALRKVYRERFVLIGAHAPRDWRLDKLADDIAESRGSTSRRRFNARAHELAQRDEAEDGEQFGQNVRGTFPLSDFFVDVSNRDQAVGELDRFFRAFFGYPFATPTRDEYAMFHAAAAAV